MRILEGCRALDLNYDCLPASYIIELRRADISQKEGRAK